MATTIDLKAADGHTLSAYRTGPEGATHGLVVVQEIFGVNGHMRDVSERFAAAGYAVITPALFDRVQRGVELGYGPEDTARGRELRTKVPEAGIVADIEAAAAALGSVPMGIVGYCWGGTVAWWGATRTHAFKAAVGWYGGGIAATKGETPHCPVQLHFGETDSGIPLTDVEQIRTAQPEVEVFVYPGAGHGFGCTDRNSFKPEARDLAQQRTLEFLGRLVR
ncbi:MAG: dienelactone hydrolase family protein [Acetobacteraceae bacterium]